MRKFWLYVAVALVATLPGLSVRLAGMHVSAVAGALIAGLGILAAGFMLSWGLEAAEEHVSRGLALAVLALITVLPEFVVDFYYALQGERHPGSEYVQFAAANMTGANRLLVGFGWPAIVLLYWWRSGKRSVELRWDNAVEISFLALGSLYSFVIVLKQRIEWFDAVALFVLFAAYLRRLAWLPKEHENDAEDNDDEPEVGPGAALNQLPRPQQFTIIAALAAVAGAIILFEAEPFAESLIGAASVLGVNKFLLIQWVSPLAGELPEIIIMILFTLSLRPGYALGALISDKINQWTLLVGTLPVVYSFGAGTLSRLPLDARQGEEFFLTAAQSLFAVALLLRLRFSLPSALILLVLFLTQLGIGFVFQHDEVRTIQFLTWFAWLYLLLAVILAIANRALFIEYIRVGLLNQPVTGVRRGVAGPESAS
ncbi:MAG: sodium:proton exchanger [Gammaproteobacteria bacterium]|nr:sodium:proton exchanger [Gammaproteobacteria bacterium]